MVVRSAITTCSLTDRPSADVAQAMYKRTTDYASRQTRQAASSLPENSWQLCRFRLRWTLRPDLLPLLDYLPMQQRRLHDANGKKDSA